jgi:hypothetical protein
MMRHDSMRKSCWMNARRGKPRESDRSRSNLPVKA